MAQIPALQYSFRGGEQCLTSAFPVLPGALGLSFPICLMGLEDSPQGAAVGSIKKQTGNAQRGFIAAYASYSTLVLSSWIQSPWSFLGRTSGPRCMEFMGTVKLGHPQKPAPLHLSLGLWSAR